MTIVNLNQEGDGEHSGWRVLYRYAVFEHKLVFEEGNAYTRSFIVLKNQYDVIVHFTSFHNYIDAYAKGICIPLASDAKAKMHYVCMMLNYIFIYSHDTFGIGHVFHIEKWMLDEFFQDYALEKQSNGSYRSRQSIEKCIFTVTGFFRKLIREFGGYMKITSNELYIEKTIFTRQGKRQKKLSSNFKVRMMKTESTIFRDIPTKAFQVLINQAFTQMPEIAFAICISAFAGLRPGEVCNVRQEGSPLGSGLEITFFNGTVKSVEIDLRVEYRLRSDGVRVGGIKKERRQRVYPAFLPAFCKAYEFHKSLIYDKGEKEYCPMFMGSYGKAMTYFNYRSKFQRLITEYVRPALLRHTDPECRLYGQLLYEHRLGPQACRHWFTVQLVLMGETVAGLQYWRGDSNPESALTYLQNKGDLVKELSAANDLLAEFMVGEGGGFYDGY